jgi:hypothetical protein
VISTPSFDRSHCRLHGKPPGKYKGISKNSKIAMKNDSSDRSSSSFIADNITVSGSVGGGVERVLNHWYFIWQDRKSGVTIGSHRIS